MRRPRVHIIVLAVCKHDVAAYSLSPAVHFRVVMFSAGDVYLPVLQLSDSTIV